MLTQRLFSNRCALRCTATARLAVQACSQRGLVVSSSSVISADTTDAPAPAKYIDQWFADTVKSQSFYDSFAAREKQKCYFYSVDLQGRLFLEESLPKNIATSLKDEKFLDFFFSKIRRVRDKEKVILEEVGVAGDYPFVSPCGIELNFVRPADAPIVFHELRENADNGKQLIFGGNLSQPYLPEKIAMSPRTGRLYHELVSENKGGEKIKPLTPLHTSGSTEKREYGLIKSSVAVSIADAIVEGDGFGHDVICYDTGKKYPIEWLPAHAEAGEWGVPFLEECDE